MSEKPSEEESKAKSIWSGVGSMWNSVKKKTLDMVDTLQDQITKIDKDLDAPGTQKEPTAHIDDSILPVLENASTYLDAPTNSEYQTFYQTFKIEDYKGLIHSYSEKSPNLRRIHSRLVPSAFTEEVFWSRLFFKLRIHEEAKEVTVALQKQLSEPNINNKAEESTELTKEELEALEKMEEEDENWGDWA